jgi:U3 small nucleolar RNA-associated protein 7
VPGVTLCTSAERRVAPPGSVPAKPFARSEGINTKLIGDKKLKGQVKRAEQVTDAAVRGAKKVYEWLKPSEAGELAAEGAERTWQFQQRDIVKVCLTGRTLAVRPC